MALQHLVTSWTPRSFQMDGVVLCLKQACAGLLYKPGLGKTSVMYMVFRILQDKGFVQKCLVICPLRPSYVVWPHQKDRYEEFQHLRVNILHGKEKEKSLIDDDADIYVINPEGLAWLTGAYSVGGKVKFDAKRIAYVKKKFPMLIVDESTKFRNPQTGRFKLLRALVPHFKRRYILTGSFTPKSLLDLFGQVYILDEGQSLGRYISKYRNEYFYPGGYGGFDWTPQPDAADRIAKAIAPLVQVVEQKGNVDVPALLINDIYVVMDKDAKKSYVAMENEMLTAIESGAVVAANAAVASGKCRQIANGAVYDEFGDWHPVHDLKIDALEELIEQLQGQPLLITYQFEFDKERIAARLKIPCISTGNIKKDTEYIQKFARGELIAVMGHPQSVSLGTDGLQDSCHDIAMVGVPWSFLDYEQTIDRVKRQGNTSDFVTVHRILTADTVDERVISVLEGWEKNQAEFMKLLKRMTKR